MRSRYGDKPAHIAEVAAELARMVCEMERGALAYFWMAILTAGESRGNESQSQFQ